MEPSFTAGARCDHMSALRPLSFHPPRPRRGLAGRFTRYSTHDWSRIRVGPGTGAPRHLPARIVCRPEPGLPVARPRIACRAQERGPKIMIVLDDAEISR